MASCDLPLVFHDFADKGTSRMGNKMLLLCSTLPGHHSLLLALLDLASENRSTQIEGNHSSTVGDIHPLYYRWEISIFKCIRGPAATVTQNYIVCRTTVCHPCENRQKTFPMRSDKNRSCLFESIPLLKRKKKKMK